MPYGVPSQGIRPGLVERGEWLMRKRARRDGYWIGRLGLPLPLASEVRPYGAAWSEGYAAGLVARREYDHAEAVKPRPEDRRKTAALDRPSASRGLRRAGGGSPATPSRGTVELRAAVAVRPGGETVAVGLAVGR